MRHATKWNDKALLEDEPLNSAFLEVELRGGTRIPDKRFFGDLARKVKGLQFGVRSDQHSTYVLFVIH